MCAQKGKEHRYMHTYIHSNLFLHFFLGLVPYLRCSCHHDQTNMVEWKYLGRFQSNFKLHTYLFLSTDFNVGAHSLLSTFFFLIPQKIHPSHGKAWGIFLKKKKKWCMARGKNSLLSTPYHRHHHHHMVVQAGWWNGESVHNARTFLQY